MADGFLVGVGSGVKLVRSPVHFLFLSLSLLMSIVWPRSVGQEQSQQAEKEGSPTCETVAVPGSTQQS